jgi:Spy/CpxP family protein refolding chaperone
MTQPSHTPRARRAANLLAIAVAFCAGGTLTYFATAPSALAASAVAGIDGPGWMAKMHGHSPADLHAHMDAVLTDAGASDAQKQQIAAIVRGAMEAEHADMRKYHGTWSALKQQLSAPRIDEAAVERIRDAQDGLFLDTSRRLSETAVQIARTLTPAQRQALAAEIDRRMASGHHAHE